MLDSIIDQLRLEQKKLTDWEGGQLAVSAVPGSGKTHSLAVGSAIAIAKNKLNQEFYLLIVTYTRSATTKIKQEITKQLAKLGLPPIGFSVQTIHALALNIASQYPNLSQLNLDSTTLIDPNPSHDMIKNTVEKWINKNWQDWQTLIEGKDNLKIEDSEKLRRQLVLRSQILPNLAYSLIKEAKSSGLSSNELANFNEYSREDKYNLLKMGGDLYREYEILMKQNNFIDYEDMILGALRVLENNQARDLWQQQIFAVFEDEAQDSTPLQGKLINILATTEDGSQNLIRVGDPNQAINSTFTTADPLYFRKFCENLELQKNLVTMTKAGRSSEIIIKIANYFLDTVNKETQKNNSKSIKLPFRQQYIELVAKNDPQLNANPQPEDKGVEIYLHHYDIYKTVTAIGDRLTKLFCNEEKLDAKNAAVLVKENKQGKFVYQKLQYLEEKGIKVKLVSDGNNYGYLLEEILTLLKFIQTPHSTTYFEKTLAILKERKSLQIENLSQLSIYPEILLYPTVIDKTPENDYQKVQKYLCSLLKAKLELPNHRLIPFIGLLLNYDGSQLATLEKLSEEINQEISKKSSLKMMILELMTMVRNNNFQGIEEENDDLYTKKGQVTIITMHKSKGLDWDYVFLPFLNRKMFPSKPYVLEEAEFLGDFSLPDIARNILRFVVHSNYENKEFTTLPSLLEAWEETEKLTKAESYRLLYVAITRAKSLLWMSACNKAPFSWKKFKVEDDIHRLSNDKPCSILRDLNNYVKNL